MVNPLGKASTTAIDPSGTNATARRADISRLLTDTQSLCFCEGRNARVRQIEPLRVLEKVVCLSERILG